MVGIPFLTPRDLESVRQNRPTLVARDFEAIGIPASVTYRVLLRRGVFKWLAARRDLIRLKAWWKGIETSTQHEVTTLRAVQRKYPKQDLRGLIQYKRGYLAALRMCRADVRAICHGPRWQAPDNDPSARRWLESLGDAP